MFNHCVTLTDLYPGHPTPKRLTRWIPPRLEAEQPVMLALAEFRREGELLYPANHLARALCALANLPAIAPDSEAITHIKAMGVKVALLPPPPIAL